MASISKILRVRNEKTRLIVTVELDDGMEATIYVGGQVETFFHKGQVRAWVKKNKDA